MILAATREYRIVARLVGGIPLPSRRIAGKLLSNPFGPSSVAVALDPKSGTVGCIVHTLLQRVSLCLVSGPAPLALLLVSVSAFTCSCIAHPYSGLVALFGSFGSDISSTPQPSVGFSMDKRCSPSCIYYYLISSKIYSAILPPFFWPGPSAQVCAVTHHPPRTQPPREASTGGPSSPAEDTRFRPWRPLRGDGLFEAVEPAEASAGDPGGGRAGIGHLRERDPVGKTSSA